jgi:GntR family transcriptional regulator
LRSIHFDVDQWCINFHLLRTYATVSNPQNSPHALPIYVQIAELLTRDIVSGRLIDGERLKPERDMAAELNVSVGTLRKALRDMGEKGLIDSVQGSGNYVRAGGDTGTVYAMFRLELLAGGGLPRAQLLSLDHMDKPADLPAFGTSSRATRIRRLRSLNDTIMGVEEIWLDADAGMVDQSAVSESLYATYRKSLGLWIQRAEDRVSHVPARWLDTSNVSAGATARPQRAHPPPSNFRARGLTPRAPSMCND